MAENQTGYPYLGASVGAGARSAFSATRGIHPRSADPSEEIRLLRLHNETLKRQLTQKEEGKLLLLPESPSFRAHSHPAPT